MCAYFSQSLKIKMSKNTVKTAKQFLLNQKNIQQNLLHVLFYILGVSATKLLPGFSHFATAHSSASLYYAKELLRRCFNPSRIFQISNLPQNSLIHLFSFLVEPPAVFSKISERALYVSQKHSAVFVAFLLVVVDYLNARKIQCL